MNEETEIEISATPIAEVIGVAEDIADPLDGLVEKCAADPGAAFTPEVLERLAELKKEDRAAFELLRSKLKKAGCRVTALDEAIAEESGDTGRGPTQADILIGLTGPVDAHVDTIDAIDAEEPAAVPEPRRSDPAEPGDQA
jgi:hypothetical protein